MNKKSRFGHLFVAGAVGALAIVPSAHAENITNTGAKCRNTNWQDWADMSYSMSGVTNSNAAARSVTCGVLRDSGSLSVYVDGSNTGGASTSCTLYSYNYDGTLLASQSFMSSLGTYDQLLTFTAAQAPSFAYFSLQCTLPGGQKGKLFGATSVD